MTSQACGCHSLPSDTIHPLIILSHSGLHCKQAGSLFLLTLPSACHLCILETASLPLENSNITVVSFSLTTVYKVVVPVVCYLYFFLFTFVDDHL